MSAVNTGGCEWAYEDLRRAVDAAGVALWLWNVDTNSIAMDPLGYELWDVPPDQHLTFEDLSAKIHPADRDRVRAAFSATRAVVGAYEIDFRTLVGTDIRWISARGQGNDAGIANRHMTGVFLNISERKQAEEGHELLAGEMSHRVKNLLAIATGLTKITSRTSASVQDMTLQLTQRLTALDRAHDLVRPLPRSQGRAALLGDLISVLLAPYDADGAFAGRIRVAVPRMGIGEYTASGMAMVLHELATNSLKYGALSVEEGTLDISGSQVDDAIQIVWAERGGPQVVTSEPAKGFGSSLVQRTVGGQFGGSIAYDWSEFGLIVTLRLKAENLSR